MKAKDVNKVAKETLRILLDRCIDVGEIREFAGDAAWDEGISLDDFDAVQSRVNVLLGELRTRLIEDY